MPSVSLRLTNWIREDVIFSLNMALSLPTSKDFACLTAIIAVVVELALHYATECIFTVSWHTRKPVPNFEQEWLKRVANKLVSRHEIRRIVKFISENQRSFPASLAFNFPAS
ncbi:hypothetical protein AVEN_267301-1 [Araneus ventricosus]|uniref:Uncharacterized protein n=1 Tax=Araneus ventricosus TaxID=182803 RepID=A0A4Y2DM48_ARAVE|nr:hypothetical protein AVEN_267301-1 [Araneus ventricosus]